MTALPSTRPEWDSMLPFNPLTILVPPALHPTYKTHAQLRPPPPSTQGRNHPSTASYPLTLDLGNSCSSTGTSAPDLTSSSELTSDSDQCSPPISPKRHAFGTDDNPTRKSTPSPIRPSLRHMPSWRSIVSLRSLRSARSAPVVSSDDDLSGEENETFADALSDNGPPFACGEGIEGKEKDAREREWSTTSNVSVSSVRGARSSHKSRLPVGFRKYASSTIAILRSASRSPKADSRFGLLGPIEMRAEEELIADLNDLDGASAQEICFPVPAGQLVAFSAIDGLPGRIDTPFSMPGVPGIPGQLAVSKLASTYEAPETALSSPTSPQEFFTPLPVSSAVLVSLERLPSLAAVPRQTLVSVSTAPASSLSATRPSPSREDALANAVDDPTSDFALDIFSPRVLTAPVLRGIIDSLPISPLELPAAGSVSIRGSNLKPRKEDFPSPMLPRNPVGSPAELDCYVSSLAGVTAGIPLPSRSMFRLVDPVDPITPQYISSGPSSGADALSPHTLFVQKASKGISSLPAEKPAQVTPYSRRSSCTRNAVQSVSGTAVKSPYNSPIPRRVSAFQPTRLPSPTPPSLINSPKSLPPVYRAYKEAKSAYPCHDPAHSDTTSSNLEMSLRRRRSSRAGNSTAVRGGLTSSGGLGLGPLHRVGSGFRRTIGGRGSQDRDRKDSYEHVATPRPVLVIEADLEKDLVDMGVNPYFA